jgi:hypothetical protein
MSGNPAETEEGVEEVFDVGSFVLGYDSESGEWKSAEIVEITESGYKVWANLFHHETFGLS